MIFLQVFIGVFFGLASFTMTGAYVWHHFHEKEKEESSLYSIANKVKDANTRNMVFKSILEANSANDSLKLEKIRERVLEIISTQKEGLA